MIARRGADRQAEKFPQFPRFSRPEMLTGGRGTLLSAAVTGSGVMVESRFPVSLGVQGATV